MENVQKTTIQLIRYILTGDVPVIDTDTDFELLYGFSRSHGVECMVYDALKKLDTPIPSGPAGKFENAYIANVMIDTMQTEALKEISQAFENAGIDHIPLKGSTVKFLYPMPHYRKCGDIDILIKPEDEGKTEKVMTELGYKVETGWCEHDIHATFKKGQNVEIEIHKRLVSPYERSSNFCDDVWKFVILLADKKNRYGMINGFLYVYLLSHICKHLYYGGAGIRLVTDLYVVKNRLTLDEKEVADFVIKAKLTELEGMLNPIMKNWFEKCGVVSDESRIIEKFIFESESFGNSELHESVLSSDSLTGKLSRFRRQVFPTAGWLKMRYETLSKKSYPLIYMWIYSWTYILKKKRYKIPKYIKETFSSKRKNEGLKKIVKAIRNN